MIKNSFIRNNKINLFQKDVIVNLLPIYSIIYNNTNKINLNKIFQNKNKNIIEIGFGNGEHLIYMALKYPNINFLGIELYKKGISLLLLKIHFLKINNLRVVYKNAYYILNSILPNSVYGIHLLFPDPWSKKKHNKRRLISNKFTFILHNILLKNGYVHIVTDVASYYNFIINIFFKNKLYLIPLKFINSSCVIKYTKYQKKMKCNFFSEMIFYKK